jgi:hypothetical protein
MGGCFFRVFALACLDRLIACFDTLDRALAPEPAAVIVPFRPRRDVYSPRRHRLRWKVSFRIAAWAWASR